MNRLLNKNRINVNELNFSNNLQINYNNKPKCLAILLFHNEEDLVQEQIDYWTKNKHDIIIFNHNSNDNTQNIIVQNKNKLLRYIEISDDVQFKNNDVFKTISYYIIGRPINIKHLKQSNPKINDFREEYDWISFPESDEFLEGPDRTKSYYEHLCDIHKNKNINGIIFRNIVFWFTEKDDQNIKKIRDRIKHYCYKQNCGIRVYAWRANLMNIREWNHNLPKDTKMENMVTFNTCHYEMRSEKQMINKIKDRINSVNGNMNHHYGEFHKLMKNNYEKLIINSNQLHYDDGNDLIIDNKFDWTYLFK